MIQIPITIHGGDSGAQMTYLPDVLLTETGDHLITESGDHLITES